MLPGSIQDCYRIIDGHFRQPPRASIPAPVPVVRPNLLEFWQEVSIPVRYPVTTAFILGGKGVLSFFTSFYSLLPLNGLSRSAPGRQLAWPVAVLYRYRTRLVWARFATGRVVTCVIIVKLGSGRGFHGESLCNLGPRVDVFRLLRPLEREEVPDLTVLSAFV